MKTDLEITVRDDSKARRSNEIAYDRFFKAVTRLQDEAKMNGMTDDEHDNIMALLNNERRYVS